MRNLKKGVELKKAIELKYTKQYGNEVEKLINENCK